jgi:NhaP-type Na+/H+ and K+/H+ antiporter
MIIRDQKIIAAEQAGPFNAGDHAYFLAPPQKIHTLDLLFSPADEHADQTDAEGGLDK